VEYPVSVVLDALYSERCRQVKRTTGFQDFCKIAQRDLVTMNIDLVTVSAEPDVLEYVQAGERIAIPVKLCRNVQKIAAVEDYIRNSLRQRPDVQDFDFTKTGYLRDKTVDPRAKVDMPDGALLKNLLRNVEILMKIVSPVTPAGP